MLRFTIRRVLNECQMQRFARYLNPTESHRPLTTRSTEVHWKDGKKA